MDECKFVRNMKQLEEKGIDTEKFWLEKLKEECLELAADTKQLIEVREMSDEWKDTSWFSNWKGELSDVMVCIINLTNILDVVDLEEIEDIGDMKQDRAFKEGGRI